MINTIIYLKLKNKHKTNNIENNLLFYNQNLLILKYKKINLNVKISKIIEIKACKVI